ncbi:hypothetical protein HY484_04315 [Candidatus Woesearchaeota archaeon]|nr:hypothetical protein [Candidatus Woesearchaeota archaeon]
MKKVVILVIVFFTFSVVVSAACTHPKFWPEINNSLRFCGSNFFVKDGLKISNDNLFVDCGSAVLQGFLWQKNVGITIEDRNNVTFVNCRLVNYGTAIMIKNSTNIFLKEITLLRNMVGLHVINSVNISIVDSLDISLHRSVRFSNSSNVTFQYHNKNIKGDFCRTNNCGN